MSGVPRQVRAGVTVPCLCSHDPHLGGPCLVPGCGCTIYRPDPSHEENN